MNPVITEPDPQSEAQLNAFLDERIYEYNMEATGFRDGRPFAGVVKGAAGDVIAAINGHTWGGCCYIAHLWVHTAHRRRGMGRALLESAEKEALRRGCGQALVLTHSFQAPEFYERHGYVRRATVPNYPHGHAQHVYAKPLTSV